MQAPFHLPSLFRDQNFKVARVTSQDVIHAGPKLVPAIFKVNNTAVTFCLVIVQVLNR